MANKLYAMEQLTEEVAKDVAASPQEWMRFLNTASRLYKYTFPEQLLIYAQRPEATAVASMEIWNQKMYRWIKKGSKGIALIDNTSEPKTKLRYVFDVQDTYKVRNLGKDPQLWNLPVEGEHLVADYLQEQLSLEDTEGGLAESLHQAAKESMQEWLPDALEELRLDVTGTFLEELDEQNQEVEFRELMTNSVWYVLLNRCGLDVQEYLDVEDFRHITDFNQLKVLGHLGSAVNEISRPVLMQIGRYVLNDLENDLKTVAKEKEVVYNEFNTLIRESNTDNTEDREEKKEETDYERDQLQPERRVSDSRYQPGRDERNHREVWNDEERVSEKSQGSQVQHSDTAEPSGQSSDGDRQSGKTESRQPDERTSGERSGTGQDGRHNGVDQTHEPDQSTGRGTGNSGDYLQLSLFPTEEEQLGEIRKAAAALEQPAAFLISDEVVDDILRTGSGQKNTLFHITARLIEGLDNEEMRNFLKNEYGTGGKGFTIDGQKISIWYDNDGIRIRRGESARRNFDRMVTWEEAADRIRDMYEDGNYVDNLISNNAIEQEQEEMTNLLALHFRDTCRNWEKNQSYSDWQDVVSGAWTDQEKADAIVYRFEWLQKYMDENPGDYYRWEIQHNPEYFQRFQDLQRERSWVDQKFTVERPALSFITQDEIDAVLRRGGITAGGRNRIYEYFMEGHDQKETVAFLKNEYGIGGGSGGLPGNDDSHNEHDGKGIRLEKGSYGNPYAKVLLNWNVVEKRLRELIKEDKYLSPQGKENYKAYKEEQAEKARQREISRLEHGQRLECKKDIDALIAEKFNGFVLPRNTADEIIDKYGIDCVEFVLANTVTHFDYDGRFSQNNKDWAKGIVAENEWQNNDLILNSHPAVLDGFTNQARRYINVLREKGKEAQQKITIDGYECVLVDEWGSEKEKYLLGNNIEDSSFYYAQVNGKTFEYDHKPERSEVEDDYINAIAEEDIDRHEAEVFSRFEGTDGIAEPDETELQQEFSQEKSQKLSWHVVHDADDEYGNPTQWSATLSEGVFLWIDKEAEGYAIYDTADTTRPALETFSTLQEAMDWGNELAESGREAEAEFSDEKEQNVVTEQTEDELDSIDTQSARERLENGEADRQTEEMLSQVLTGDWEPLTPSSEEKQPASERQSAQERSVSAPDKSNAVNFHISDDRLGEGSPKEKFQRNVAAIKLLEQIEGENRYATSQEQQILSQYVGWGGLADAFDESKSNWSAEYHQLKELLSPEEYRMARESTLNAHYTSPVIISQMYETLEKMGFSKGNVLEPSMGIGNFFGMMPDSMKESRLYGVELDSITGRIAGQLYPQADVQIKGFEKTDYPNDFFDVAIGNVPFGQYKVADKQYDKNNFLIHDYFFAKTLDKVRSGGVVAFITSKGTMDKASPEVRRYLAQRADLLGAVRLPNTEFKANAGTEVTSDILFFQKRDRMVEREPDWVHLGEDADGIAMNAYFAQHPEQIVGKMEMVSGPYGMESTCKADDSRPFAEQLAKALQNITGQIDTIDLDEELADDMSRQSIPADPSVKNFSYTVVENEVYYRENSVMKPVEVSDTAKERIKGMVAIRNCTQELIDMQLEEYSDAAIKGKQAELNTLYDSFSKKYGLINSQTNKRAFNQDSSYCLLCSLEKLDDEGNFKGKADMFTKRTIKKAEVVTSVDTASEALAVSLSEKARVDLDYMAELTGKDVGTVKEELTGIIFQNPLTDQWETADEYLSGNVRDKLETAKVYVESHPEYAVNVQALTQVQPKELDASEIEVRIGATWIDPKYIEDFMRETFETPQHLLDRNVVGVQYSDVTGQWNIKGKNADYGNSLVNMTYGTSRRNAYTILEDSLNLKDSRVFDTIEEDGKEKRVLNKKETTIASQKQEAIREAFKDWVFRDPERRQVLVAKYNQLFNSTRPREYDGSHLKFPGMTPDIELKTHQKNAVAHVLYGDNTLLAHCVGAGKTFEMTAAAMESKRLGLCQKSLFVVPNHLTEQWASDFLRLYPGANILAATKKDFEPANRKKFCSRIATGDYDAVIIGHSQFEKIPLSQERQVAIIER